ncbi:class I SAM-dependent methyltransferase [Halocalculus aciditolerans]|uniref:Methyltransferase domain-containing protein n=1 Tax=Halocalculus aciditolerans TaxID=1383812 RepID=A0A830FBL3_9EURY|nr:class I SAM-dependent methyltransferase [Halocalculus aciditolerans]GGL58745.1 hypothetical protein GCM10009039_16240 [Halocalculus aciditolerans]
MGGDSVREAWSERSGEYSPDYYAYYGPDEVSEAVLDALDESVGRGASVLELGCSSGRHLAHLHENGYESVAGVDINADAFDVMADAYPDLAEDGEFHVGAIEDVVAEFEDGAFDAVYSVETLQHIHRDDEWVFEEIARVAGDALVTVEIEETESAAPTDESGDTTDSGVTYVDDGIPLYCRNWRDVFTVYGFEEAASRALDRDVLRVFRATN